MSSGKSAALPSCIIFVMLFGFVSCDIEQDKAECTNQLVGLATCLPYVSGQAKAPTMDCCNGAKHVVEKSMKCLCVLIKDRNDPSLGLKINITLALNLPRTCNAPTNLTKCIELLHLPQSSADAKVFQDFARSLEHPNSTTPAPNGDKGNGGGSSADVKSKGARGYRLLKVETIPAILLWLLSSYHIY